MFDLHAGKKRNLSVADAASVNWAISDSKIAVLQVQEDNSADILVVGDLRGEVTVTCTGKLKDGKDFTGKETANVIDAIAPVEVPIIVGDEV